MNMLALLLYKLVCSKKVTKFAFRKPNPTLKMKIKLTSESNVRLKSTSDVGQMLDFGWK